MKLTPCRPVNAEISSPFDVVQLSDRPRVYLVRNFLSSSECGHLIELAKPHVRPALTVNSQDGSIRPEWYRSNSLAHLQYFQDSVVAGIENRISELTGLPTSYGEALQVLRYHPDEQYIPHYDFFPPKKEGVQQYLDIVGQRYITILMYLNEVEAGGETYFPKINIKIPPKPGDAVLFYNLLANGEPDTEALHAGSKVIAGEKWLATKWLHNQVCHFINENNEKVPFKLEPISYNSQHFFYDISGWNNSNNNLSTVFFNDLSQKKSSPEMPKIL